MIIKLIIDRFEGDKAVLKTKDNDTIVWPKNQLPKSTNEGMSLLFAISGNPNEDKSSRDLAKEILNDILKPEP